LRGQNQGRPKEGEEHHNLETGTGTANRKKQNSKQQGDALEKGNQNANTRLDQKRKAMESQNMQHAFLCVEVGCSDGEGPQKGVFLAAHFVC
jgi:hypothetical protein